MIKTPISLQDLRRNLYIKAKAEPNWRFWGLYVHVCKMETLREAYEMAKKNDGAPGIDGVTFEAIEESGVESFLEQIRNELTTQTYQPMLARKKEIPKDGGTKVRVLSIPSIRDRVVRGPSSSSWSRFSKLTSNRDRTVTDRNEPLMKRSTAWPAESWRRRPKSSTLTCELSSTTFSIRYCWKRWPSESGMIR